MVQSLEQREGKRKCEGKDFPLVLIPRRKDIRSKQDSLEIWLPGQGSLWVCWTVMSPGDNPSPPTPCSL